MNYQKNSQDISINLKLIGDHRKREYDSLVFIKNITKLLKDDSKFKVIGPFYGLDKWIELSKLDLLIQPSRTEGMPNTVLEAMSIGIPCAVTPQTNMADIIENSGNGWVINLDEKEIEDFFHFISGLEKEELLKKGMQGKEYARKCLTWEKVASNGYK